MEASPSDRQSWSEKWPSHSWEVPLRSLPGVLCWETIDKMPGFSSLCTMKNSQEVGPLISPELLNCSLFQTGFPTSHPIIFIHPCSPLTSLLPPAFPTSPFHYQNFQILCTAPTAHHLLTPPHLSSVFSQHPSILNPSCVSVKDLCEPDAQNSLLFPLWSHSACTAFISNDLVLHLPPNWM